MQSVQGGGVVSSFFLYNLEAGCIWPAKNNEIDIEMTGNANSIYFTTHHPGTTEPSHYGENFEYRFKASVNLNFVNWGPKLLSLKVINSYLPLKTRAVTKLLFIFKNDSQIEA